LKYKTIERTMNKITQETILISIEYDLFIFEM